MFKWNYELPSSLFSSCSSSASDSSASLSATLVFTTTSLMGFWCLSSFVYCITAIILYTLLSNKNIKRAVFFFLGVLELFFFFITLTFRDVLHPGIEACAVHQIRLLIQNHATLASCLGKQASLELCVS